MLAVKQTTRVALFGAAPDTANMGVTALYMSTICGLSELIDEVEFVVFDNGLGKRENLISIDENKRVKVIRYGARGGLRYYRSENLLTMLLMSKLGKLGAFLNEGISLIDTCNAVLDISGGDSFSDIYGMDRFNLINRPKKIAVNRKKSLILLPQTYGPYNKNKILSAALKSINDATMVWARDINSFNLLKNMLGEHFNNEKHKCGVDMAFSLKPVPAENKVNEIIKQWIKKKNNKKLVFGINISGLIYNNPDKSKYQYNFKDNYQDTVFLLINEILERTAANIIFISHVMDITGHYESDVDACINLSEKLNKKYAKRIEVAPVSLNESEVKWLISKMDWFCGTRMHSTIAGLSSCVPTSTISYSDKAKGVFESCGQGNCVVDPRDLSSQQVVDAILKNISIRDKILHDLQEKIPLVIKATNVQLSKISKIIEDSKDSFENLGS